MNDTEVVTFFKSLKPGDWAKKATSKWSVKDVLAHLVGWEKEVANELKKIWNSGEEAWFMDAVKFADAGNYNDFNEKIRKFYEDFTSDQLILELEKWQGVLEDEVRKIGEANIKNRPGMEWVFNEGGEPHFEHHVKQVKKVLGEQI